MGLKHVRRPYDLVMVQSFLESMFQDAEAVGFELEAYSQTRYSCVTLPIIQGVKV